MSRVDEALQRANAQSAGAAAAVLPRVPAGDGLVAESFPVEPPQAEREPVSVVESTAQTAVAPAADEPEVEPFAAASPIFNRIDAALGEKVIVDENIMPVSREQYRRLAAVLHDAQVDRGLKVVMVASAVAGEGKTLTASNLALTLSESYRRRVLLVDGDLRRPTLHQLFRVTASSGLSEGLNADDSKLLVRQLSPRLSLLPGGRPNHDPMAGLVSPRMQRLITEAREAFDWVIIDTPPLVMLPDANLLAPIADGVVLVIQANSTPHELVTRAVDAIGRDRILGVVLNGTTEASHGSADGYYGYAYPAGASQGRDAHR